MDGDGAARHQATMHRIARGASPARSKYTMRMSKAMSAEVNTTEALSAAADAAWDELKSDRTRIVELAVIRGASQAGVTDRTVVKKLLLERHGEEIRTAVE